MPKLIVQQGNYEAGGEIALKDEMYIGRDESCDIILPDGLVSRQHACLTLKDNSAFVEDLSSYNGTFLNWIPIVEKSQLKHLDVLQIGKNVFVYAESDEHEERKVDEARPDNTVGFTIEFLRNTIHNIEQNVQQVFKGKNDIVRNVLLCMLADGHVLVEDSPGVGKTILAQAVAKSIQGSFKRIQFTPDMLPSDIIGISIYNEESKDFKLIPGPIFGNIILADEINRTTPRTQSSLLECMNDAMVTVDGTQQVLPRPFCVIATQNPFTHQGTYPLPEAQLDRFLMKLTIGFPSEKVEMEILSSQSNSTPLANITYVAQALDIVQCSALVRQTHVSEPIKEYIVKIANATREHPALVDGVSPRASLNLMRVGQALAAYNGRQYVIPQDIKEMAPLVLAHRVHLKLRAQTEFMNSQDVILEILSKIPIDEDTEFEAK